MCVKCSNDSCAGECTVTRQIKSENSSIGRDGESAYDIAIRTGKFSGTEAEYAEWTKGQKGTNGINGVDGDTYVPVFNNDIFEI